MPKLSGQSMICDASSLISLTDSCFIHALYFLKRRYKGNFIIPPSVEYECVQHPMHMKMHSIHAIRLKRAINEGVIEVVDADIGKKVQEIRWTANNLFYAQGTPLRLLQEGETEMLALSREIGVDNLLIDERTTRMLAEDPESLRQHLEEELRRPITVDEENLSSIARLTKGIRFFRSSELLLLAYEKGYFADYGKLKEDAIEASLYKLKYSGCAVGFGEISDYISRNVKE
ncbi:TPA: hypothetical protein HA225_02965 [Candidatus Micrarchaeota archaeon]|nr:hypothetical protein [Candidatus Micrarchaeota archaeon]HIH30455.1 hypothetical protein [Candidatus Micrarchaeota archaeon]